MKRPREACAVSAPATPVSKAPRVSAQSVVEPDVWEYALQRLMPPDMKVPDFKAFALRELGTAKKGWQDAVSRGTTTDSLGQWLFNVLTKFKEQQRKRAGGFLPALGPPAPGTASSVSTRAPSSCGEPAPGTANSSSAWSTFSAPAASVSSASVSAGGRKAKAKAKAKMKVEVKEEESEAPAKAKAKGKAKAKAKVKVEEEESKSVAEEARLLRILKLRQALKRSNEEAWDASDMRQSCSTSFTPKTQNRQFHKRVMEQRRKERWNRDSRTKCLGPVEKKYERYDKLLNAARRAKLMYARNHEATAVAEALQDRFSNQGQLLRFRGYIVKLKSTNRGRFPKCEAIVKHVKCTTKNYRMRTNFVPVDKALFRTLEVNDVLEFDARAKWLEESQRGCGGGLTLSDHSNIRKVVQNDMKREVPASSAPWAKSEQWRVKREEVKREEVKREEGEVKKEEPSDEEAWGSWTEPRTEVKQE